MGESLSTDQWPVTGVHRPTCMLYLHKCVAERRLMMDVTSGPPNARGSKCQLSRESGTQHWVTYVMSVFLVNCLCPVDLGVSSHSNVLALKVNSTNEECGRHFRTSFVKEYLEGG